MPTSSPSAPEGRSPRAPAEGGPGPFPQGAIPSGAIPSGGRSLRGHSPAAIPGPRQQLPLGTRTRGPRRSPPERGRDGRPEGWRCPRPPGALPSAAAQPRSASQGTTSLRSSNSGTSRSSIAPARHRSGPAALSPPLTGTALGCSGGSRAAPGAAGPSASYRAGRGRTAPPSSRGRRPPCCSPAALQGFAPWSGCPGSSSGRSHKMF